MFPGMSERLCKELSALAPPSMTVEVIAPPERQQLAWLGGSTLASLANFQQTFSTKQALRTLALALALALALTLARTLARTVAPSLTRTRTRTLALAPPPTRTLTLALTLTLTLTITITLTLTLTLTPSRSTLGRGHRSCTA